MIFESTLKEEECDQLTRPCKRLFGLSISNSLFSVTRLRGVESLTHESLNKKTRSQTTVRARDGIKKRKDIQQMTLKARFRYSGIVHGVICRQKPLI